MMTLNDVAKALGVSRRQVCTLTSKSRPIKKRLRVVRLGHRTVFVRPVDFEEFIQNNMNV